MCLNDNWLCGLLGSPAVRGEEGDDNNADDVSDFNYPSGNQDHKQKIGDRMMNWHSSYGQGDEIPGPKYDSGLSGELPRSHIPMTSRSQVVNLLLLFSLLGE